MGALDLAGKIHIKCVHVDGSVETREVDNIVTAAGKGQAAFLLNQATALPFTAISLGVGTAAAVTTDTALGTELTTGGFARFAATLSRVTTDDANDTTRLVGTWTSSSAGATVAVTECGAHTTLTVAGSIMLGRQVFAAVNMVQNDVLEITYDFDVD